MAFRIYLLCPYLNSVFPVRYFQSLASAKCFWAFPFIYTIYNIYIFIYIQTPYKQHHTIPYFRGRHFFLLAGLFLLQFVYRTQHDYHAFTFHWEIDGLLAQDSNAWGGQRNAGSDLQFIVATLPWWVLLCSATYACVHCNHEIVQLFPCPSMIHFLGRAIIQPPLIWEHHLGFVMQYLWVTK